MLGSLLSAVIKTATLPVDIAVDALLALPETAEGEDLAKRTKSKVSSIVEDLNDVL